MLYVMKGLLICSIFLFKAYAMGPVGQLDLQNKCLGKNNKACNILAVELFNDGEHTLAYETADLSCARGNKEGCLIKKQIYTQSEKQHQATEAQVKQITENLLRNRK